MSRTCVTSLYEFIISLPLGLQMATPLSLEVQIKLILDFDNGLQSNFLPDSDERFLQVIS